MTEHQRPFYNLCNSQYMAYSSSSVSAQWNTLVTVAVLVTSPQQVSSHELGSMHVGYLSVEDDKARNKHPVQ